MHLSKIDEAAKTLQEKNTRLERVEDEIETLIAELREKPKKAARETRYAAFVGAEAKHPEEIEKMEEEKDALADERETLHDEVDQAHEELLHAFTSDDLVVPLTMDPQKKDREWVFPFRDEATFPHAIRFLGDTVGLGNPIRVEGVLITDEGVRVPIERHGMDESQAMETVMDAFEQLQNTLEIKLPDDDAW